MRKNSTLKHLPRTQKQNLVQRMTVVLIAVMAVLFGAATPQAMAVVGYDKTWNPGPNVSFTNTDYTTSSQTNTILPNERVGVVTYDYSYTNGVTASVAQNLNVQLCNNQRCVTLATGTPSNGSLFVRSTTSAFSGDPSGNTWYYKVRLNAATKYALQSNALIAGTFRIAV